jgi:uroporphyrinogen-III synthase
VSVEAAARGDLDGALFSSSLTVEHFLDCAKELDLYEAALQGLNEAVVGCIGNPTRDRARALGVEVEVVPEMAEFNTLAQAVVDRMTHNGSD